MPPTFGREAELARGALVASDGTIEGAAVDVVHFPLTMGVLTKIPSIYQPHDLQHLHLPAFFTSQEIERREVEYRTYCDQASLVVMMTSWGKRDVVDNYDLPESKVAVIAGSTTLSSLPQVRCMGPTRRSHPQCTTTWTIRSVFTRQRKKPMN